MAATASGRRTHFGFHRNTNFKLTIADLREQRTYRLKIPGTLSVEMTATCEEPTLCNLTQHSYFNLDDGGAGDILDHRLMLNAGAYLPVDGDLIPTGVVKPVDDTPFDFRQARPLRMESEGKQLAYDQNFCLAATRGPLRQASWAQGANSGVEMELWTTEPGVQLYTGQYLAPPSPGLEGRHYKAFSGFCLEPQVWTRRTGHISHRPRYGRARSITM
nr:hypothetical protein [Mesorhizobium sp. M6A.T.Ce.TU.016.01.1.1]